MDPQTGQVNLFIESQEYQDLPDSNIVPLCEPPIIQTIFFTIAKPTQPGWYWWRLMPTHPRYDVRDEPQIVRVDKNGDIWDGDFSLNYLDIDHTNWAGPLTPPEG